MTADVPDDEYAIGAAFWDHLGAAVEALLSAGTPRAQLLAVRKAEASLVQVREHVATAAVVNGWSYADLGDVLGITRQGARQRYGPLVEAAIQADG